MAIDAIRSDNSYEAAQAAQTVQRAKTITKADTVGANVQERVGKKTEQKNLVQNLDDQSARAEEPIEGALTSDEKMHKALDDINRRLAYTSCEYGYDDATRRVTIKIIDKQNDEVIRELPPEKTLEMIAKAWELAGILLDERL